MKHIEVPAYRLTSKSIVRSFQNSHKKHLFITGSSFHDKSALLKELLSVWDFPEEQMPQPMEGFLTPTMDILQRAMQSPCTWFVIEKIGDLANIEEVFPDCLRDFLEKKHVIAVVDKSNHSFMNQLRNRPDTFICDLDMPLLSIGCVVMASGNSSRFGSDKLLADLSGKPLITHICDTIKDLPFPEKIVVTRSADVKKLCDKRGYPSLLHNEPKRSDTIRLGLSNLLSQSKAKLGGCFFLQADQPLVSKETLETMALSFSQSPKGIYRLSHNEQVSSPVLFADSYFQELLALRDGESGSTLIKKYPEQVHTVPARGEFELWDIDTKEDLQFMSTYTVPYSN